MKPVDHSRTKTPGMAPIAQRGKVSGWLVLGSGVSLMTARYSAETAGGPGRCLQARYVSGAGRGAVGLVRPAIAAIASAITASVISAERPGRSISTQLVANNSVATSAAAMRKRRP